MLLIVAMCLMKFNGIEILVTEGKKAEIIVTIKRSINSNWKDIPLYCAIFNDMF